MDQIRYNTCCIYCGSKEVKFVFVYEDTDPQIEVYRCKMCNKSMQRSVYGYEDIGY